MRAGERVLDIGCGDAYLVGLAAEAGARVTGLDFDAVGLRHGRSMLGRDSAELLVRGGAGHLPIASGTFDLALQIDVIEHLADPAPALAECARILTPQGRLVVTTPKWRPGPMWDPEHHVHEYRPEELRALLGRWFRDVEVRYFTPIRWLTLRKRLGKVFVRWWARRFGNPFAHEGTRPDGFCDLLAIAKGPREG